MKAAIFDIDGTLVNSSSIDAELFVEAVSTVLGPMAIAEDWSSYTNVTDQGILREILLRNGLEDRGDAIENVKNEFTKLTSRYIARYGPFSEMPGAVAFVRAKLSAENSYAAYATGGWREVARLKLASADFPLDGVVLVGSDVHESRTSIMETALSEAPAPVSHVTYYGDGEWDKAACETLGWEFVAVGERLNGIKSFESLAA